MSPQRVFVAYPYSLFPSDDYRKVFRNIENEYDVIFNFADEQVSSDYLLNKISNMIRECELSLFDITGWNPNVTLELGLAVGLDKRHYILFNTRISQQSEAPTDIRGKERIQYTSYSEMEMKLSGLFKKINRVEINDSELKYVPNHSEIIKLLSGSPGLRVAQIAEALKAETTKIQPIVRSLLNEGELKTKGEGRGTKYYTRETDLRRIPRK